MPNTLKIANNWCFLTISLAIVDTRSSSFEAPQQGEVIAGTDISHTLIFYFPNVIGVVQLVRFFLCVLNRMPRTERFNDNTHIVTPLICMCLFRSAFNFWWFKWNRNCILSFYLFILLWYCKKLCIAVIKIKANQKLFGKYKYINVKDNGLHSAKWYFYCNLHIDIYLFILTF